MAALAMMNLGGSQIGRVATWIFQSILQLAGGFVTAQQVFAVRFSRSAFAKSGDDELAVCRSRALGWVADARARVREEGHVFFGEVMIVPSDHANIVRRIEDTKHMLLGLDWRLYDVTVSVSERLEWAEEEEAEQEGLQP